MGNGVGNDWIRQAFVNQETPFAAVPVGIVIERRKIDHPWQEWSWQACEALPGAPVVERWKLLREEDGCQQYHAATEMLELHRKDTESYLYNLNSPRPSLFVVIRELEDEDDSDSDFPVYVHLVTASPFEAQDYLDSSEETVDAVPLPDVLAQLLAAFIDEHHVEEKFIKRKRDKVRVERHLFGKDPIFEQTGRVRVDADGKVER